MATKPAFLFKGKESPKEENAEKKVGKAAYARGEKAEKSKGRPFAAGGAVTRGNGAATRGTKARGPMA